MIVLRTQTIIKIKLKILFIKFKSPIIIPSSMNNRIYKKNTFNLRENYN